MKISIIFYIRALIGMFFILNISHCVIFFFKNDLVALIVSFISIIAYSICVVLLKYYNTNTLFVLFHANYTLYILSLIYIVGWGNGFDILFLALLCTFYINMFDRKMMVYVFVFEVVLFSLLYIFTYQTTPQIDIFSNILFFTHFIFFICLMLFLTKIREFVNNQNFQSIKSNEIKTKIDSNLDFLTGLLNKRGLEQAINNAEWTDAIVCMCDIDDFKHINDKYGHNIGDKVIKSVAEILNKKSKKNDIICRFGGEEFLVISFDTRREIFIDKIKSIMDAIRATKIRTGLGTFNFSLTFGISNRNNDIDIAIKQADDMLYKGKKATKNCIIS